MQSISFTCTTNIVQYNNQEAKNELLTTMLIDNLKNKSSNEIKDYCTKTLIAVSAIVDAHGNKSNAENNLREVKLDLDENNISKLLSLFENRNGGCSAQNINRTAAKYVEVLRQILTQQNSWDILPDKVKLNLNLIREKSSKWYRGNYIQNIVVIKNDNVLNIQLGRQSGTMGNRHYLPIQIKHTLPENMGAENQKKTVILDNPASNSINKAAKAGAASNNYKLFNYNFLISDYRNQELLFRPFRNGCDQVGLHNDGHIWEEAKLVDVFQKSFLGWLLSMHNPELKAENDDRHESDHQYKYKHIEHIKLMKKNFNIFSCSNLENPNYYIHQQLYFIFDNHPKLCKLGAVYQKMKVIEEKKLINKAEIAVLDDLPNILLNWVGEIIYRCSQAVESYNFPDNDPYISKWQSFSNSNEGKLFIKKLYNDDPIFMQYQPAQIDGLSFQECELSFLKTNIQELIEKYLVVKK